MVATAGDSEKASVALVADDNFAVWAENKELADDILARANELRRDIAIAWLDGELPDGFGPATISVRFMDVDQSRTWLIDGVSKRAAHSVWIKAPRDKLESSLAHEIAHVVLANRYPDLPPFAQEGVASQFDDADRRAIRQSALEWFVRTNRWPRLADLFRADAIPPSNQAGYAASVSLAEYLLSLGRSNKHHFLEFAERGQKTENWDATLHEFYGIDNVAQLQRQWQRWAQAETVSAEAPRR